MTSVPACPYCNAALPLLPAAPAQSQTPCPRCGEPVGSERFPIGSEAAPAPGTPELPQRKRRTMQAVLAIMCGMAVLALVFAVLTRGIRRERDPRPVLEAAEEFARRPVELTALGYLPTGTNLALGVQVAALEKEPTGQELLREPRPAVLSLVTQVLNLAGLQLKDLDHFVAGSELKSLNFNITTVLVTRQPYNRESLKAAAQQHKAHVSRHQDQPLYQFTDLPGVPNLWCAAPRVLVYTTLPKKDLAQIPANTKEPAATLTPPAREALADRLNQQSRVWAVGDLEPAKDLISTLQVIAGPFKEQVHVLSLVRKFAIGVAIPETGTARLTGDFYTGAPAATREVRKYLESVQLPGTSSQKVETPPLDIDAPEAQWVAWQVRMSVESLRTGLDTLPLGKGNTKSP